MVVINFPLADFLSRMKVALTARKPYVEVVHSYFVLILLRKMLARGLIASFNAVPSAQLKYIVNLKYLSSGVPVIDQLRVYSSPGAKIICSADQLKKRYRPTDYLLLSTNNGVIWVGEAIEKRVGGFLLVEFKAH